MSEQQNTALIKDMDAAFVRGDVPFILGSLASDIMWTTEGPAVIPYCGTKHGLGEVLGFFESMVATLQDMKLTTNQFIAQGNMVATFGRFAATVKATGKSFDVPVAHYFRVRDGRVTEFTGVIESASIAAAYTARTATAKG